MTEALVATRSATDVHAPGGTREDELWTSAALQRALLANLPAGVIVVDAQTREIEAVNDAAVAMFGAPRERILGRRCHKFLCPAREGECPVCDLGRSVDNAEREIVCADGSVRPVLKSVKRVSVGGREKLLGCFLDMAERKRSEAALRDSEAKFRTLYEATSDAVMLLDEAGFFDCNRATLTIFGCATLEEFTSKHPADLSPPQQPCGTASMTLANRRIATAMETGSHAFEWMHMRADTGETFPAEVLLTAMELDGRQVLQAVVRDITDRKRAEEALLEYKTAVEQSSDGIALGDLDGRIRFANEAWAEMHGYCADELIGRHLSVFHTREQMETEVNPFNERLLATGSGRGEIGHARADGTTFPAMMTTTVLMDAHQKPFGLLGIARDITNLKESEQQRDRLVAELRGEVQARTELADELYQKNLMLNLLATTDTVTGLANRHRLMERLHEELERAQRYGTPLAVAMVDLDDFKRINDTHGHEAGDAVLKRVAHDIAGNIRSVDLAARYGGEEFTVLLPHLSLSEAVGAMDRVRAVVEAQADGPSVTMSVGVAAAPPAPPDLDVLLSRADAALYQAKRQGKNRVVAGP